MPVSDGKRKWWHISLDLEDRNLSVLQNITTIDETNINSNADSSISARLLDCSGTVPIPARAWDASESPGYFIFRPNIETLDSVFVDVSSYDEVINLDNRRVFRYKLRAAYNNLDDACSAIVPNDLDPAIIETQIENVRSIVFRMAEIQFLDTIGCCSIAASDTPDPLPEPGIVSECTRLWYIVDDNDASHLYSYDIESGESVDRGSIHWPYGGGTYILKYYDIAWDDRNYLWGLEENGLTRILIGSSSVSAYAINYANINNPFSDIASPFPIITPSVAAYGALSYNASNGKLYMFSNRRLWELQSVNDTEWEVSRVSYELGENENLGDLAFGVDGECYCFHNNKLATISFAPDSVLPFGFIQYVGDGGEFSNFVGLDFIAEVNNPGIVTLYGVKTTGQLYVIDPATAEKVIYSGDSFGDVTVGLTSCQAGEDLRTMPFPFFPGRSPWLFMIDTSGSMAGSRLERVKSTLISFLSSHVNLGDKIAIMPFGDTFDLFGPREMRDTDDVAEAAEFINSLSASGNCNFCSAFTEAGNLITFNDFLSVIVIADGQFADCGSSQSQINANLLSRWQVIQGNNPGISLYSVGLQADIEDSLTYLGSIGGGGYVRWE